MATWNSPYATQGQVAAAQSTADTALVNAAVAQAIAGNAFTAAGEAQATADAAVPADQRPSVAGNVTPLSARPWETNASTLAAWPKDQWRCVRVHLKDAWTVAGLGVVTSVAASVGTANLMFGIWAVGATGLPAARLADWSMLGVIDLAQAPGTLTLATPGLELPAGEFYVGVGWTGTSAVGPTITTHTGLMASTSSNTGASTGFRYDASGGSVPNPFVPLATTTSGILVLAVLA